MSMLYLKRKIIRVRFDSKMKNEYKYRSTSVMEVHISVTNMYRESPIFSYPSMVSSTRWPPPYQGGQVLLYDSKLHLFMGKLKSRWIRPFIIHQEYPNGSVDLINLNDNRVFKVNGQRVKPYSAQHTGRRVPSLTVHESKRAT